MSTINRVILSGRLAQDPEIKEINPSLVVGRLSICTSRKYKQRNGEEKEEVCYIDASVWNQEARLAEKYLKKGSAVTIDGALKQEKWTDRNTGQERSKHVLQVSNIMYMEKMPALEPASTEPNPLDGIQF